MNNLNSIILEGEVAKNVTLTEKENGKKVATVVISTKRTCFVNETEQVEESLIEVDAYGNFAEDLATKGKVGRGIRVVGRIKAVENRVFIVAEHLEYKTHC